MKLVPVDKKRSVEVPETWLEAEDMLTHALGSYYDERGRNIMRLIDRRQGGARDVR